MLNVTAEKIHNFPEIPFCPTILRAKQKKGCPQTRWKKVIRESLIETRTFWDHMKRGV